MTGRRHGVMKPAYSCGYFFLLAVLSGCGNPASSLEADQVEVSAEGSLVTADQQLVLGAYPLPVVFDPCKGETFEGRCVGNTLIWCESYRVRVVECKRACGWDDTNQFYSCL
jgi:hypothetical protein